ncbi:uncharacterized protein [Gossypium hirsutum]|uniref:Uncharacterized protein n=1 Tax=Gossypium hirsutum TaxID=3635 RepID=A0ABM2ZNN3_GOSHI|nr:uncharacterized protein LOC121214557 [Gossypium hirsutum]
MKKRPNCNALQSQRDCARKYPIRRKHADPPPGSGHCADFHFAIENKKKTSKSFLSFLCFLKTQYLLLLLSSSTTPVNSREGFTVASPRLWHTEGITDGGAPPAKGDWRRKWRGRRDRGQARMGRPAASEGQGSKTLGAALGFFSETLA